MEGFCYLSLALIYKQLMCQLRQITWFFEKLFHNSSFSRPNEAFHSHDLLDSGSIFAEYLPNSAQIPQFTRFKNETCFKNKTAISLADLPLGNRCFAFETPVTAGLWTHIYSSAAEGWQGPFSADGQRPECFPPAP